MLASQKLGDPALCQIVYGWLKVCIIVDFSTFFSLRNME